MNINQSFNSKIVMSFNYELDILKFDTTKVLTFKFYSFYIDNEENLKIVFS